LEILTANAPNYALCRENGPRQGKNSRKKVLEQLYLYALKFFGKDSEKVLLNLIDVTKNYRPDIALHLEAYHELFIKTFYYWKSDGNIFYTHNLLIASIKQLFYYYSFSMARYKNLLSVYLGDMEKRSQKLSSRQSEILQKLAHWLLEEAEKEKVFVM
jgi:hypothetical protein